MKMITGCKGFIGSHFQDKEEKYIGIEQFNAVHIIENLPLWNEIDEIIDSAMKLFFLTESKTRSDINWGKVIDMTHFEISAQNQA